MRGILILLLLESDLLYANSIAIVNAEGSAVETKFNIKVKEKK